MKKIFLSFGLIVAFAFFATFTRQNVGISADRFLTPNVSILNNNLIPTKQTTSTSQPTQTPTTPIVTTSVRVRNSEENGEGGSNVTTTSTPIPVPKTTTTITTTTKPIPTPVVVSKPVGQYKDGTYTGSVADAYYGNIQVQAVISGGRLTDVIFLQYPSDRRTSVSINTQAMPYLKSEAISAQSANVNIVSGASDSSQAFRQSQIGRAHV